jgi:hypothetical protein
MPHEREARLLREGAGAGHSQCELGVVYVTRRILPLSTDTLVEVRFVSCDCGQEANVRVVRFVKVIGGPSDRRPDFRRQ